MDGVSDGESGDKALSVWIDADPAYGELFSDTDDVFALLQALGSPELAVRGVSVVHGNMRHFDHSVDRTRELVRDHFPVPSSGARVRVPVAAGARGSGDLGRETPASRALEQALERERLSILALGPLTTVATVLGRRPDLHERIEHVVAVAGRRPGEHLRPNGGLVPRGPLVSFSDMNFELDPEAFHVLLDSEVPVTLVPYEACSKVALGSGDLRRLQEAGALPPWLLRKARSWLWLWTHLIGVNVFFPFDTLAVGVLASPGLVRCEWGFSATIRCENHRRDGRLRHRARATLEVSEGSGGRPVGWCLGPEPGFTEDLLGRLIRLISGGITADQTPSRHQEGSANSEAAASGKPTAHEEAL